MLTKRFTGKKLALTGIIVMLAGIVLTLFFWTDGSKSQAYAEDECQTFDTGYKVCGRFLDYWRKNGGLTQQGNPISQEFEERNAPPPAGDGEVHKVQYFERARFEYHYKNQYPYDVLLGLLGTEQFRAKYGAPDPNAQFLTLRGRRTEAKIANYTARENYTFLILDMLIRNTTVKKVLISPASIIVRTAQVYDYKVSDASYASPKVLKLTELNLNEVVGGELVFEVPTYEVPKTLTIDYFDGKAVVQLS